MKMETTVEDKRGIFNTFHRCGLSIHNDILKSSLVAKISKWMKI